MLDCRGDSGCGYGGSSSWVRGCVPVEVSAGGEDGVLGCFSAEVTGVEGEGREELIVFI